MEDDSTVSHCVERATWYVDRIDELLRALAAGRAHADSDVAEQCQAMVREIKGRFSVDKTTPQQDAGTSAATAQYLWCMRAAGARLRFSASSRPSVARWGVDLAACRAEVDAYLSAMRQRYPGEFGPPAESAAGELAGGHK